MNASLADSLPLLFQTLAPELANDAARADAVNTARALLPDVRGDLEVRLNAGDGVMDVLQCFNALPDDLERLQAHASAREDAAALGENTRAAWRALEQVAKEIRNEQYITALDEIWLECDAQGGNGAPSLFLSFRRALDRRTQIEMCERILPLLLDAPYARLLTGHVGKCCEACPAGARVSHIGIMLGRAGEILRVNIKGLTGDTLGAYLERVEWHGSVQELRALWSNAHAHADHITLCLDIGERILPSAGLECVLGTSFVKEPRREAWLAWLVSENLATIEKCTGLRAWEASLTPAARVPWSAPLIVESLLAPPDVFARIETRLSHIKLVYAPPEPVQAKAYLWFAHHFSDS